MQSKLNIYGLIVAGVMDNHKKLFTTKEEVETTIHQLVKEVLKFDYYFTHNNCGFHPMIGLDFVPSNVMEEGWLIMSEGFGSAVKEAFGPITPEES
jgi:hypothetical protein